MTKTPNNFSPRRGEIWLPTAVPIDDHYLMGAGYTRLIISFYNRYAIESGLKNLRIPRVEEVEEDSWLEWTKLC